MKQTVNAILTAYNAGLIKLSCEHQNVMETALDLAETEFFFDEITPAEFAHREYNEAALDWVEPSELKACQSWQEVFNKYINGNYAVAVNGGVLICERVYIELM